MSNGLRLVLAAPGRPASREAPAGAPRPSAAPRAALGEVGEVRPGRLDRRPCRRGPGGRRIPLTSQCIRAPPISSSVTFSPMTSSAMRGEPRYIEAFCSTMNTTSQNAGMYAPPGGRGPEQAADLGDAARRLHLVVEDLPAPAAAREQLHLVGDPRPGRVDQVDDRELDRCRASSMIRMIFSTVARPPRTGLHRRVVGHDRHRPAVDRRRRPVTTPSAGRSPASAFDQQAVLGEPVRVVEQQRGAARGRTACPARRASAWYLGAPPARARSAAAATSSPTGRSWSATGRV